MTNLHTKIAALLEHRPIPVEDIVNEIASAGRNPKEYDFEAILKVAKLDDLMDGLLAAPVTAFLPAWGEKGINTLISLAFDPNRKIRIQHRAIEALLAVSLGRCPEEHDMRFLPKDWSSIPKYSVSEDIQAYCSMLLREQLLDSLPDPEKKPFLYPW